MDQQTKDIFGLNDTRDDWSCYGAYNISISFLLVYIKIIFFGSNIITFKIQIHHPLFSYVDFVHFRKPKFVSIYRIN